MPIHVHDHGAFSACVFPVETTESYTEPQYLCSSQERTSSWGTHLRVKCQLQCAASICHKTSCLRSECQGTSVARSPCLSHRNGSGWKASLRSVCILNAVQPLLLEDTEEFESVGEGETPTIRAKGKKTSHSLTLKREKIQWVQIPQLWACRFA